MSRVFFYSDPHFGHEKIIEMSARPFDSVKQMNSELIKNWNKTVSKGDTVYVLGDIAFYMRKEEVKKVISQLKGKKILILGNHDRGRSITWWFDVGFHTVLAYPLLFEFKYLLSHEPLQLEGSSPYINIHGHLHEVSLDSDKHICVSVEQTNYRPILLENVLTRGIAL